MSEESYEERLEKRLGYVDELKARIAELEAEAAAFDTALWSGRLQEVEQYNANANARIAELEAQVAEMRPVWEAVEELERQILKGDEKDIFLGVSDEIPPCVHLNFDWAGTLAECLIAEAWKEDPARRTAALIALSREVEGVHST